VNGILASSGTGFLSIELWRESVKDTLMALRCAVIGAGAMGTACAWLLAKKHEHQVYLWCRRPDRAQAIAETRINEPYLPLMTPDPKQPKVPFRIPETITITSDQSVIASADVVILAVPMVHLRTTLKQLRSAWPSQALIVSVVKGIEQQTHRLPSEVVTEETSASALVALTGPSHAEEIVSDQPASVVAAGANLDQARRVRDLFGGPRFRVYSKTDVRGAEIAGAMKNVIAIAAGIGDGLGFGINAKAALVSRGMRELNRLPDRWSIKPETINGLAGVGDLVATCCSEHSRNRGFGEDIGRGGHPQTLLTQSVKVIEGAWTARAVFQMAQEFSADLPLMTEVYRIIFESKNPKDAVADLLNREQKDEDEKPS
jgi:glycerol-3-phosphate dehydrogenase (NAD(P)+)